MTAPIIRPLADLRAMTDAWRANGETIGAVLTMGALHEGHLSLVRKAQEDCERVIVTVFVNPRQFNSAEDYAKYPRTELADAELLSPLNVDAVFVPDKDEVYPPGYSTTISVSGISGPLEGANRPGHFDGVATVVTMLLNMTQAQRTYFGEKDWQQLQLVRRLVNDLKLPVKVIGCPTIRSGEGLALSSRNRRLSDAALEKALILPQALLSAADAIASGEPAAEVLAQARQRLTANGIGPVDYLELRDSETLEAPQPGRPMRLLVAAWLDGVRLIDNTAVG